MDDHFYSDTRMFRFVREAITKNQCVLIHGEAGYGKSALMNHVAWSLQQNDYDVKKITKFSEIDSDSCLESKTLYLFDDAFGTFNYDISFIHTLEHYSDIKILLRRKHSKIITTSRSSVYRKLEKFNFSAIFYVIDLNDAAFSYNDYEKKGIFRNKCGVRLAEHLDKAMNCKHHSFPLLCAIFSNFPELQKSPHHFFTYPERTFLHFLDTLQNTKILTYYSLVFLVLNGQIKCPIVCENNNSVIEKLMLVIQACSQHLNIFFSIEDCVEKIEKEVEETRWFKKDNDDIYTFRHMFFYEIVAYHFGKNNITTILTCMGENFIAEKVLLKEEHSTGFTIPVEIEKLQERLLADIRDFKKLNVFTNAYWRNPLFCHVFQQTLKESTELNIEELFWGSKCAELVPDKCMYKQKLTVKKMKAHIPLKCNDSEWFRQRLLEDRLEMIIEKRIMIKRDIKSISWVIGYGIFRILPDILGKKEDIKKVKYGSVIDGVEQIRLLTLAILSENVDCFDIIFDYVDHKNINSNCMSKSGLYSARYNKHRKFTPLTMACYNGFSIAIRKLVREGAVVDLKDQNGSMPLVLACRFGSLLDCKYLVNNNANLNCTNKNGETPLIAAVMNRNTDIVKFLLDKKAATNQCTSRRKSPLYYAAKRGCSDIVKLLID